VTRILDTVLLLALPASGKSEVRRYLELMPEEARRQDFHMGTSVQLDDYPYVHLMRRIDQELAAKGLEPEFFRSPQHGFADPHDWATLIHLVNEDHDALLERRHISPDGAGLALLDRIDRAAGKAGVPARLGKQPVDVRAAVAAGIDAEAAKLVADLQAGYPDTAEGKTLVIEFARGGPQGASFPLPEGYGYAYSLAHLSPRILESAAILYIWVTPEDSRRKNAERAVPDDPGSILHHGVPLQVLLDDYSVCDMEWLAGQSDRPGTVRVEAHGRTYHLPMARFDNRQDKTSFLREEQSAWGPEQIQAIHDGLRQALDHLAVVGAGV
jgi:hypothetical protein